MKEDGRRMSSQRIESSSGHKNMERKTNTHIHTHHNYYTLIFGELRKSDDLLYYTNKNNKHTQNGKKNKKYKILFLKISMVVSTPTNHRFLFVDSSYPFLPCLLTFSVTLGPLLSSLAWTATAARNTTQRNNFIFFLCLR